MEVRVFSTAPNLSLQGPVTTGPSQPRTQEERPAVLSRTQASNCRWFPVSPESLFPILLAFDRYAAWWPEDVGVRVLTEPPFGLGTVVEIATSGNAFQCTVEAIEAPLRVAMRYDSGLHDGTGVWSLEQQNGGTEITFAVDLRARGLAAMFLPLFDVAGIHSRLMQKVFDGLERHLAAAVP
ncbi:MAG: hypothetical protein GC191_11170 [Azospirillum sp.]|nr:hypothetical protein [Azospirillum sp.]